MTKPTDFGGEWWLKNLSDIDREIARQALNCKVRLLAPGVIERVLRNDASVCGTANPRAFEKLRTTLMMHYHIRDNAVQHIGEPATQKLIEEIVAGLRAKVGDKLD
ncbi:MAG: hypothetical protein JSR18_02460 [Proteobacteria bacterium]|nr:hypothetical protein [Pseudomonadota bacterium]